MCYSIYTSIEETSVVYALQIIKKDVEFSLGIKKRSTTIDPYFEKEFN